METRAHPSSNSHRSSQSKSLSKITFSYQSPGGHTRINGPTTTIYTNRANERPINRSIVYPRNSVLSTGKFGGVGDSQGSRGRVSVVRGSSPSPTNTVIYRPIIPSTQMTTSIVPPPAPQVLEYSVGPARQSVQQVQVVQPV